MISLQLIEKEFLKYPVLYLSDFFERNRQSYYDALDRVRHKNDLEHWIVFFLEGVVVTAQKSQKTFEEIIDLRERYMEDVASLGRKNIRGRQLLSYLFSDPIVGVRDVEKALGVSYATANELVDDFVRLDFLEEKNGFSRNRLFIMTEYITLFKG